ncbi:MAG: DNA polymerase I [Proteobacteria bacterium]|nr:DNA polymerase I [Pseudomonadota bacterium]
MPEKKPHKGDHIYLIDGSGYIFRAYYALRNIKPRSDGTPINAVLGFSNMLYKLLEDLVHNEKPTHIAVIFDAGRRTFRNDIYPDYKAHRPDAPEDLIPQFPLIREAVAAFNVPCIEMKGYEADDIIATYAKQAQEQGINVTIVSSDKDLMQLVEDGIELFDSMKNRHIGPDQVKEKFGVGPDQVIDVQALAGDSVDNIPGVPGIGVKTAAELINTYGDLETLLERAEEIKQPKRRESLINHAEDARIAKQLVTLKQDVPLDQGVDDFKVREIDPEVLYPFLDAMEFKALKAKAISRLGALEGDKDPAPEATKVKRNGYQCISEMKDLKAWIGKIREAGLCAVDTETTGLNVMRADLVGISLALEAGEACYIPLRHKSRQEGTLDLDGASENGIEQIPFDEALKALKPLLEDPGVLKIGQNIKYDTLVFLKEGIRLGPIDDTMLISYVLEAGLHGHGMDELAVLHLDHKPVSFKDVAGVGKNQVTFDYVPLDQAVHYAAEDADITARLWRLLKPQLAKQKLVNVYETLERPLVPVLAEMEKHGIKVDGDLLSRLSNEFAERLKDLEAEIHKMAGCEFNIASPKQLGKILFEDMKFPGGKKGKSGDYSTSASVLEQLVAEGHEFPARILDWRQLAKLKNTYTDSLQNEVNVKTGRVHTSFAMAATSTGRLASSDPNIQNIPIRTEEGRKIRKAFIAEPGNKLLSADYSQIELRLLAHMADIKALKEAFRDGLDIHAMTASEVFGVPIEGMDPATRRKAKAINFGIIYGISAFGLANQIGVTREEARAFMDTYFKRFPGIQNYMETTKEFCRKKGYVETLFGRRCHVRSINDKNPNLRAFGERAAINAPLQGSAADIIRRAMIRMPEELKKANLPNVKMLLQVHDELIFETPEQDLDKAIPVIKKVMEGAHLPAIALDIPLTVDCGFGDNWDQAH